MTSYILSSPFRLGVSIPPHIHRISILNNAIIDTLETSLFNMKIVIRTLNYNLFRQPAKFFNFKQANYR